MGNEAFELSEEANNDLKESGETNMLRCFIKLVIIKHYEH